jgi:hypothetical protein
MKQTSGFTIEKLIQELDQAVLHEDTRRAEELAALLFRLQGGTEENAVMPEGYPARFMSAAAGSGGGKKTMSKTMKRLVYVAAAVMLAAALSITAMATGFFGIRDLVIGSSPDTAGVSPDGAAAPQDLIVLQGYPDSNEYKAVREWHEFLAGYDTDHAILNQVGNSYNEFYEKYPMYLVYSREMADKLEEITAKYGLALHESMTVVSSAEELYGIAGTGRFLSSKGGGANNLLGGYVYNDGTFHYDGQALLPRGTAVDYQLGNYVKGTFSDTYLNVGDAGSYETWTYTNAGGTAVSLALGEGKAVIIADLGGSFVTVNVLADSAADSQFTSSVISKADLQAFADLFDFTQLRRMQTK